MMADQAEKPRPATSKGAATAEVGLLSCMERRSGARRLSTVVFTRA